MSQCASRISLPDYQIEKEQMTRQSVLDFCSLSTPLNERKMLHVSDIADSSMSLAQNENMTDKKRKPRVDK